MNKGLIVLDVQRGLLALTWSIVVFLRRSLLNMRVLK